MRRPRVLVLLLTIVLSVLSVFVYKQLEHKKASLNSQPQENDDSVGEDASPSITSSTVSTPSGE